MTKIGLPKGFLASGIHCGVKKKKKDLSLIYSKSFCTAAALFTKNTVKAAPVVLMQEQLEKNGRVRAVVINSGNANCMTGKRGFKDAVCMTRRIAKLLAVKETEVLVSSTGIIGEFMRMDPILNGMDKLVDRLSRDGLVDAADGIITTDNFRKISSRVCRINGKAVTITGIAKGAGMIEPNMATMLCYILTDANISRGALKKLLSTSTDSSFNAITVDGDMSTNDTVLLMANGNAENELIKDGSKGFKAFQKNLDMVSGDLARMIVMDGEGASKFVEVCVKGAKNSSDAGKIARAIADSLLVKCAVLGGDPNWGRIASSAGSSAVKFDPDKMDIILDGVAFLRNGKALPHADRKTTSVFKKRNVRIEVNVHCGKASSTVYTCDISKKYITLNSYYTT